MKTKTSSPRRRGSKKYLILLSLISIFFLSACTVGPDYRRPVAIAPLEFKEAPKGWKYAEPQDDCNRGAWWKVFNDTVLNELEEAVNISNQNIRVAVAQFWQAKALVDEARAAFYPVVGALGSITRQKLSSSTAFTNTGISTINGGSGSGTSSSRASTGSSFTTYLVELNATWEPDLWGAVRRAVEGNVAGAEASAAQIALVRLTAQATLAQNYFQIRTLDADQKLLDETVLAYKKALKLTQSRFKQGIASELDVLLSKTQLETAEAQALDNVILRSQLEHAIAVLIGRPPACFCIKPANYALKPPRIPLKIPCALLERRPDVASSERLVKQANANIGVAISAYFPALTLDGTAGYQSTILKELFTKPTSFWSIGGQLAETLFDGGLRDAKTFAAREAFYQAVASYRQTVLAAFQDVEDNLVSLRQLKAEVIVQNQAARDAKKSLDLVMKQYINGTVNYIDVTVAQNTYFVAQKTANDVIGREMVSAVGLIRSLGGGWDAHVLECYVH